MWIYSSFKGSGKGDIYIIYKYIGFIIHISNGFKGDIPKYQPLGDTKALARYVTLCRNESPGALCHSLPKAEGDITNQGFRVTMSQLNNVYCQVKNFNEYFVVSEFGEFLKLISPCKQVPVLLSYSDSLR